VWAGPVAKYLFGHVIITVRQGRQRRNAAAAEEEHLGRCSAGLRKYYRHHLNSGAVYKNSVAHCIHTFRPKKKTIFM
jgi:hypothetical protein